MRHPRDVLFAGEKPFPILPAVDHYAGSEKLMKKAMQLQQELGPIFDITCDCEDGAHAGAEREHAEMVAALAAGRTECPALPAAEKAKHWTLKRGWKVVQGAVRTLTAEEYAHLEKTHLCCTVSAISDNREPLLPHWHVEGR